MGKILRLNRDLVARRIVCKAQRKSKMVLTKLVKRVRHSKWSEGQP
jgi:hypothetical protein